MIQNINFSIIYIQYNPKGYSVRIYYYSVFEKNIATSWKRPLHLDNRLHYSSLYWDGSISSSTIRHLNSLRSIHENLAILISFRRERFHDTLFQNGVLADARSLILNSVQTVFETKYYFEEKILQGKEVKQVWLRIKSNLGLFKILSRIPSNANKAWSLETTYE